jgi:hypothetical protein
MRNLKKYLLLLLAAPAVSFSQDKDEELIDWHVSRPLTWADYKGTPDHSSDAAASTTTYLGLEYKVGQGSLTYSIQCRFSTTKSWGSAKTEYILKHEQGHFDIAEIFARKLHKELSAYRFNSNTFREDLRDIYNRVSREKEEFQNQYDRETDHSRLKIRQEEWLKKIREMINELDKFSDYKSS